MPDSPAPFDFGYPAAPGGNFPGILGDPGEELTPEAGLGGGTGTATSGAFPVGGVFISVLPTNPATLLGYGLWESIAEGRVLISADGGTYQGGDFGGSESQSISTHPFIAQHLHNAFLSGSGSTGAPGATVPRGTAGTDAAGPSHTHSVSVNVSGNTGYDSGVSLPNHSDVSTLQPYLVVYMWVRTA